MSYEQMWTDLGLNLEAHDGLLNVLGQFYQDIYLSQENRPKTTEYVDFVLSEIHGFRVQELVEAKKAGRKVIGSFCVFVPEEIIIAANAVSVGLCSGAEIGNELAEQYLPRNTCALIKSFAGFKLAKVCPYIEVSDMIVGETTCDGKKKSFEIFGEMIPLHVMEIPQMKIQSDKDLWKAEVMRFKDELEKLTGNKITEEKLAEAIKIVNNKRKALYRLNELRKAVPTPISGRDVLLINQIAFFDDPVRFTQKVHEICDEVEKRVEAKEGMTAPGTKRLLMSGCPMAAPNWKTHFLVESSGAVIVGEESCVGTRGTRNLVDEGAQGLDSMIDNIVDRYFQIDCAVFTPNEDRNKHIIEMAKDLNVDGVVHYSLQFCQPYQIESFRVEKALEKEGIPLLKIETDYSMEDMEILKNRIDAFLGMLK